MIILDTNILWGLTPEDNSSDLLRAIRAVVGERVAVPWVVMEELAAQQAIKYQEQHARAAAAVEALQVVTPWCSEAQIGPSEPDQVRDHWRERWGAVVEVLPVSYQAFQEAAFREANCLPPCKTHKGQKIGSRDAAIWLSAVEYARQNTTEKVYFVSSNTNDFGDGSEYPAPMDDDIAGLEDRFTHLAALADLVAQFATPAETDEAALRRILEKKWIRSGFVNFATETGLLPLDGTFECTVADLAGDPVIVPAFGWICAGEAAIDQVESPQVYRIGEQEWCTAVVQYVLGGMVLTDRGTTWAACRLKASVLFTPSEEQARLTVLRADRPQSVSAERFHALNFPRWELSPAEEKTMEIMRDSVASTIAVNLHPLRGPRAYEGAWARARRAGTSNAVPRTPLHE